MKILVTLTNFLETELRLKHLNRPLVGLSTTDFLDQCFLGRLVPPGGVHDLRMDGGLLPGFQKATLF